MGRRPLSLLAIVALHLTFRVIRVLPHRAAYRLGQAIGLLFFALARKHRRLALSNLRLAYGDEKSLSERKQIALQSFMNMGLNLVDFCRVPSLAKTDLHNFIQVEGFDNVKKALSQGKGAILLTAHLGSWELMAAAGVLLGLPLAVIVASTGDPLIDQFMKKVRESYGYKTLPKRRAGYGVMSRLRRNVAVGILADQSPRRDGVIVEFFGRKAGATKGPAVFALRSGAPVIPTFIIRLANTGKHKLIFEKPLELIRTGDMETDTVRNTELFQAAIERYVRRYPEQWLWMQKRWKIRSFLQQALKQSQQDEQAASHRTTES